MSNPRKTAKTDNRRLDIEQMLDSHGIAWEYVGIVQMDQIERHREGQSRLRDMNKDLVKEYKVKMSEGAIFPPVILWSNGYTGYGIVDGNTRIEAKRLRKDTTTDAYIIEVADENEAVYVSAFFNATHGARLSKEEIDRAIILAGKMSSPPSREQLARDYGIPAQTVTKIQNVHRVTGELEAMGVSAGDIPESALARIASLSDTAVKRDLAQLIIDSEMRQSEINPLIKEINEKGSEVERLKVISDARADRAEQIKAKKTGRTVKHQPISQAAMVYGRVLGLADEFPDPKQWVPVDTTRRDEYLPKIERVAAFFDSVLEAYRASLVEVAA